MKLLSVPPHPLHHLSICSVPVSLPLIQPLHSSFLEATTSLLKILHGAPPSRRSNSSYVPSSITFPLFITATFSAHCIISFMWVMIRTVLPTPFHCPLSCALPLPTLPPSPLALSTRLSSINPTAFRLTTTALSPSNALVASSRTSTLGLLHNARAITTL
jgi:hypothetical protein